MDVDEGNQALATTVVVVIKDYFDASVQNILFQPEFRRLFYEMDLIENIDCLYFVKRIFFYNQWMIESGNSMGAPDS